MAPGTAIPPGGLAPGTAVTPGGTATAPASSSGEVQPNTSVPTVAPEDDLGPEIQKQKEGGPPPPPPPGVQTGK